MSVGARYTTDAYLQSNPDWHASDSPWKAAQVMRALNGWSPASICEVGCGAGVILRELHDRLPGARLVGYDLAPAAIKMAAIHATDRLEFRLQDASADATQFDLMLIMDVLEHVPDPIGFLADLRQKARRAVIHIPLELSVQSVLRPQRLMKSRKASGHIHYFTPETALATVEDARFRVQNYFYTTGFERPQLSTKARLAKLPRKALPRALTVRLLGGYSLLVTAEPLTN